MVQSRIDINAMMTNFQGMINEWKASTERQATDNEIEAVNAFSDALQPSKHKADREHLRNQLMDVITTRRDMLYPCPEYVNNIDDYVQMLKIRMENFATLCATLKGLKAVQGKGSGEDGKKHVMVLLELCVGATSSIQTAGTDGVKIFFVAADQGNVQLINALIAVALKYDDHESVLKNLVNHPDPESDETPLFAAVSKGHLDVVKSLLAQPCVDVNASVKRYGDISPLQWAIGDRKPEIAMCLIERPDIDLFHVDDRGRSIKSMARDANLTRTIFSKIKPTMIAKGNEALNGLPDLLLRFKDVMDREALINLINSVNNITRCLGLDEFKQKRSEVREAIVDGLTEKVNGLIQNEHLSFEQLFTELELLTMVRTRLKIIQGFGGNVIHDRKKKAMLDIIALIKKISGILIDRIEEKQVDRLTYAILFLAKNNNVVSPIMSTLTPEYFMAQDKGSIKISKAMMSCFDECHRKMVKEKLFKYVEGVASLDPADLDKNTLWIQELQQQCRGEIKPTVLFEIFRSGDKKSVDQDTIMWQKFLVLMKTGNFLNREPVNGGDVSPRRLFGIFDNNDKGVIAELRELGKTSDNKGVAANPLQHQ